MRTFRCKPYSPGECFYEYLNSLDITKNPFQCPFLRILPEEVRINYKLGPPRRYEKGGLFCTRKAKGVIHAQCGFMVSPIRQSESKLAAICEKGLKIIFDKIEIKNISEKEKKDFLDDRR